MDYVADFETTTLANYNKEGQVRVWAYSCIEIGNYNNYIYGNNIEDFMQWCEDNEGSHNMYFHNLKFDGEFIQYWLFRNDYKLVKDRKDLTEKTFTTLISNMGTFYNIQICFKKKGHHISKLTIYDSLKLLNFTVEKNFMKSIEK